MNEATHQNLLPPIITFVLDDDYDELLLLKEHLQKVCGLNLRLYTEADEFLAAFEVAFVHIGIIDHKLNAGINGIELGKKVLEKNENAKLILFSGIDEAEVWRKASCEGFVGEFYKNDANVYEELSAFISRLLKSLKHRIIKWNEDWAELKAIKEIYKPTYEA